jgi:hypothetical protein
LGQKQTFAAHKPMSAKGQKRTWTSAGCDETGHFFSVEISNIVGAAGLYVNLCGVVRDHSYPAFLWVAVQNSNANIQL